MHTAKTMTSPVLPVPLTWSDQLLQSGVKVIRSRSRRHGNGDKRSGNVSFCCDTRPVLFAKQHDRHVVNSSAAEAGARAQLLPRLPAVHCISLNNTEHRAVAVRKHPPVGGDIWQSTDDDVVIIRPTGDASDVDVRNRSNIRRRKRESTKAHTPDDANATTKDCPPTQKSTKQLLPEIVCPPRIVSTKRNSSNLNWNTTVAVDSTECQESSAHAHRRLTTVDDHDTRRRTTNQEDLSSYGGHCSMVESIEVEDVCQRAPTDDIETSASATTESMATTTTTKIEIVLPTLDDGQRSIGRGVGVRHGANADRGGELGGMMPMLLKYRIDLLRQQQQQQQTRHHVVGIGPKSLHDKQELQQQAMAAMPNDCVGSALNDGDDDEARCCRPPDDEQRVEVSTADVAEVRNAEWKLPLPVTTTTTSTTSPMMTMMATLKEDPASRKRQYPIVTKTSGSSVMLSPVRHRLPNLDVHHAMTTIPLGGDTCRLSLHHREVAAVPRRRIERDHTIITQPPTPDAVDVRWLRLACRRTSDDRIARDRMPILLPVSLPERSDSCWRAIDL